MWRTLRKEIQALDDLLPKLEVVMQFWKMAPISVRAIDPYNEGTWPNPWDLLHINEYDENVVSLGIAYTLHYSDIPCRILLVQSVEKSEIKLIVLLALWHQQESIDGMMLELLAARDESSLQ